jgi:hypothetical protein
LYFYCQNPENKEEVMIKKTSLIKKETEIIQKFKVDELSGNSKKMFLGGIFGDKSIMDK